MLRLSTPIGASAKRQFLARSALIQRRGFAERKDAILSSDPTFQSSQNTLRKPQVPLGPAGPTTAAATPATPSSASTIAPENIPLAPPSPKEVQAKAPPPASAAAAAPPPPSAPAAPAATLPTPKPKRRFSFFRFFLYLILTTGLSYGAAVFYALRSDNFHDFFTEYIPFGEEAVLYFEERSFQKRFPHARHHVHRTQQSNTQDDNKVTIPWKSGLSWRVANDEKGSDLTKKGKHMSAVEAKDPSKDASNTQTSLGLVGQKKSDDVQAVKKTPAAEPAPKEKVEAAKAAPTQPPTSAAPSPKVDDRPPLIAPITQISPLKVENAEEPVVQELVKIVNDLITVVNADNPDAANKYSAPMNKAKESLASVATQITTLREAERKAAEERIQQAHKEFDDGAKQLLQRIETAQREDDAKYREEFELERARLASNYETKLKTEVERSVELAEQRLKNELTEQAIEMKRNFISDIQSLVESERDGRLSKLSDLSTNVDDLTKLTSNWNGVIDSNLATQKLQVAVDAVRSALNRSSVVDSTPKPFVREMAALKLVADGDAIVDAAIASVHPSAYQRGIPSQPQLIDRFRRVAGEVRKASLLPEDAGVASHAASLVLSKVLFKKYGQPQGNDVESILTRTETLLEEGDLDAAAREMNGLQGWAKVLSRDWLGDVRKVLEVRQALDVIETEARLQCLRVE